MSARPGVARRCLGEQPEAGLADIGHHRGQVHEMRHLPRWRTDDDGAAVGVAAGDDGS
ncbi:hypothetical protein OG285_14030 [Streptomyces sp. NBC_01471]|uniref:hypothetical protein n=1 Tax=Streptomyces sp. NBC_01471 TaxID=2903879 RepID=UPI00325203C7